MNKNEKFVITINRELGSGGRTIGKKLAERLNVPFYDKALIKALTKKYKLSVKEIEEMKGRNHSWWAEFKRAMNIGAEMGVSQYHYRAKFSDMPDAGRSGFFVFREHPNHLSILIQASMDYRIERVARKQNLTAEEARKAIEQVDKMRENYVKKYTGFSRYDTRNYDLVLRADGKTEDELVDIILQYMK